MDVLPLKTFVKSVTAYNDGAEIMRIGTIDAQPGDYTCSMVIPRCYKLDAVYCQEEGAISIMGVSSLVENVPLSEQVACNPRALKLWNKIQLGITGLYKLASSIKVLETKKKWIMQTMSYLLDHRDGAMAKFISLNKDGAYANKRVQTLSNHAGTTIKENQTAAESEKEYLKDARRQVLNFIIRLGSIGFDNSKILDYEVENICSLERHNETDIADSSTLCMVSINLRVKTSPATLCTIYRDSSVSWTPQYQIRLSSTDVSRAIVVYSAALTQTTLEDWQDVSLVLSTASTTGSGSPAPLAPLVASCEIERRKYRSKSAAAIKLSGIAAEFKVPFDVTLDSSVATSALRITEEILGVQPYYYSQPELSSKVYRAGLLTNSTTYYLQPSPDASVYWDEVFTTSVAMPAVPPLSDFTLFFGVDKQIHVTATPIKRFHQTAGNILGGTVDKETYVLELTAINMRSTPVRVMSVLRMPISTDEKIKVTPTVEPIVDLSANSDLGLLMNPDFPEPDNSTPTIWVFNKITNNVILLTYLTPTQELRKTFSYIIQSPQLEEVEIV